MGEWYWIGLAVGLGVGCGILLAGFLAVSRAGLLAAGCHGTASSLCSKLDECNLLQGESVSECTDRWNKKLDAYTSSQKSDCESSLQKCLDLKDCGNFASCQITCP